jgi:hypothetical protein
MAYDNERIARALLAHLQANLGGTLDAVEALWLTTDALTLPDPVTWFMGYKPTLLELPVTAFPFVATLAPEREPVSLVKPTWGYQSQSVRTFVDFCVSAYDEATANKMGWRYSEAIIAALKLSSAFVGYRQVSYEPQARMISFTRHMVAPDNADAFNAEDVYYTYVGSVSVELEGG